MRKKIISRDVLVFKAVGYPLIFLFAAVCLIPFLIVIGSSFTAESYIIRNGYSILPKEWSIACARTVAVVVPSPATSLVLVATSFTSCAP